MKDIFTKDAGFVYKSFQNKTNRVIWEFFFYETNPQIESLGSGFVRIRDSRILIFKDLFCTIVLRIRWIRENRSNLLKIDWICDHDTKRIFLNQDS